MMPQSQATTQIQRRRGSWRKSAKGTAYGDFVIAVLGFAVFVSLLVLNILYLQDKNPGQDDRYKTYTSIVFSVFGIVGSISTIWIARSLLIATKITTSSSEALIRAKGWRNSRICLAVIFLILACVILAVGYDKLDKLIIATFMLVLFVIYCAGIIIVHKYVQELKRGGSAPMMMDEGRSQDQQQSKNQEDQEGATLAVSITVKTKES